MKLQTRVLVALAACFVPHALAATTTPALRGVIALPSAAAIPKLCEQDIAQARTRIEQIKAVPLDRVNAKTVLHAWNALDMGLQDIGGPIGLLSETSPDPEVRKAAEACDLLLSALPNDYLQSEALFQRVEALKTNDPVDAMARQTILDDFEERGVNLPTAKRDRAKAIFERLDKLSQDFSRNVRDTKTKLAFSGTQLQGVLPAALTGRAKDDQGNYLFGLDYPEFDAIMNNVQAEALERKELDELRAEKVANTGDKDAVLKRWDVSFYQQRLKKLRYSVDQSAVRAQFPTDPTIDWMMQVTSKLYGVNFKANKSLPVWQADVRGCDVFDTGSGQYLSSFYLE